MNGKHSMQLTLAVAVLAASTAFAQGTSPTSPAAQPSATGTTTQPPSTSTPSAPPATSMDKGTSGATAITPSKTEMSSSAFGKLDAGKRGYVTKAETAQLQGFDSAFQQADTNNDGKLSKDEFDRAWAIYSGQK
jgi:hypothetical protein